MSTDWPLTISLVGASVSLISLGLAARLAWLTKLAPPRLVGVASCLMLFSARSRTDTAPEHFVVPILWLANLGAKPMLVQDAKLVVTTNDGVSHHLPAVHSVPSEVVESAYSHDGYDAVHDGKAPFDGFVVAAGERWTNRYAFRWQGHGWEQLQGDGTVALWIRAVGDQTFRVALEQKIAFETHHFSWLAWAGLDDSNVTYFHAVRLPSDA